MLARGPSKWLDLLRKHRDGATSKTLAERLSSSAAYNDDSADSDQEGVSLKYKGEVDDQMDEDYYK